MRVFISYPHSASDWARAFADQLAKHDLLLWFDQWNIRIGEKLTDRIEQGLRESDAVVLVITPDGIRSPNLFFELGAAVAMGKKVIPIVSEEVDRSQLPIHLLDIRYLIQGTPEETAEQVASVVSGT